MSGNELINTLPDSNQSTFRSLSRESWREELPDIFGRYVPTDWVRSGGLHSTSANKIATSISLEAFTNTGNRVTADGAGGNVAINYGSMGAADNDTAWVIASAESGNSLGDFDRYSTSNFFVNIATSSQPDLPSNCTWLMKVTIAGGAITAVQDMRKPKSYAFWRIFDVTDELYGAVSSPGLSTSSRTAIQNCFNASFAYNKTVYFPPGTYFVGTNGGSTKIIDLSSLGDGITILTRGFVELVNTASTGNHIPRIFYLANNSDFCCDSIAFRDTNYDSSDVFAASGDNQGAIGFYLDNSVVQTNWGRIRIERIYATTMTSPFIVTVGGSPSNSYRVRDIKIGQIIANDTFYGYNSQNEGDDVNIEELHGYRCRRVYYVYGVSGHRVKIYDRNVRGSTGKCYIARQVGGLDTTGLDITYHNRDHNSAGSTLVAMDHIDLLGGEISGIRLRIDVKGSLAAYVPLIFRNYDGAGAVDAVTAANIVQDIDITGSCDANASAVQVTATYSTKRRINFTSGYNFLPPQAMFDSFYMAQSARAQTGLTWSGSGGNPSLGNGTLVYDIDISDGMCRLTVTLTMGNTTTFGTGSWTFSGWLPSHVAKGAGIGAIHMLDSGTAFFTGVAMIANGASVIGLYVNNNSNGIGPTVPFTWAANDVLRLTISYPVA